MLGNLPAYLANMRKAIIQVATLVIALGTAAATFPAFSDKYAALITAAVGLAGTVLHYAVPNAPAPGTGTAEDPFVVTDLDEEEEITDDMKPAELVTASQVSSSVPPEELTAPAVSPEMDPRLLTPPTQ